jgi:hypothetical protein
MTNSPVRGSKDTSGVFGVAVILYFFIDWINATNLAQLANAGPNYIADQTS